MAEASYYTSVLASVAGANKRHLALFNAAHLFHYPPVFSNPTSWVVLLAHKTDVSVAFVHPFAHAGGLSHVC